MDKTKFTTTDRLVTSELHKLSISPQIFDEMLAKYSAFSEKYKDLAEANHTAFYILSLAVMYNAGLKGGAV